MQMVHAAYGMQAYGMQALHLVFSLPGVCGSLSPQASAILAISVSAASILRL